MKLQGSIGSQSRRPRAGSVFPSRFVTVFVDPRPLRPDDTKPAEFVTLNEIYFKAGAATTLPISSYWRTSGSDLRLAIDLGQSFLRPILV